VLYFHFFKSTHQSVLHALKFVSIYHRIKNRYLSCKNFKYKINLKKKLKTQLINHQQNKQITFKHNLKDKVSAKRFPFMVQPKKGHSKEHQNSH